MPGRGVELPALREERLRAALTQDELAEQSGVARTSIARIENGARASVVSARRLARVLRIEPAILMGLAPPSVRAAETRARYRVSRSQRSDTSVEPAPKTAEAA